MARDYKMYINGQWVDAASGKTFEIYNPYNGTVFANAPAGKREDVKKAIAAADAAFPSWSKTPPAERRTYFLKAADVLEKRKDDVHRILTEETGATFGWASFQLHFTPDMLRDAAGAGYSVTGEIIPADLPGAFFMVLRQPVGVVGGISPWNAPLILSKGNHPAHSLWQYCCSKTFG